MNAKTTQTLVSFEEVDDVHIITPLIANMRDANKCLTIREMFIEYGRSRHPEKVLVDLSHVRFMSSIGVRVLVALLREVCEVQGRIMVCSLNGELRGVLFVCSLISDDMNQPGPLEVATNRDDGLARLRSP
ncbi:STAS domain-containing protein [Bremerella sp. P1]|uniref:STAS domain-containing protein n=1 Tax=Bremerella sp. P1 TaxID=3026424 RepID=UPI0023689C76|nr:STAS domain-containing protein [Bremerella sp. P1]WDI44580.1 STAS domain-containing protein [Bremerella sp. P1]